MRLLPCLRAENQRWWLPLSAEATETLGGILLIDGASAPPAASPVSRAEIRRRHPAADRLHRQLTSDPPLAIYTALAMTAGDPIDSPVETADSGRRSPVEISPDQMTAWLSKNAAGRFASGDAYLSPPDVTPAIRRRWNELSEYFRSLSWDTWIDESELWLEVFGQTVSPSWRRRWPSLVPDRPIEHGADEHGADEHGVGRIGAGQGGRADRGEADPRDAGDVSSPASMLQGLARQRLRQTTLETAFHKQLQKNKLAALKQLAYGLSHEINNPLANISTRAQQLQRTEQDQAKHATLQRIIDQVYRAYEMIADLMFFASPPEIDVRPSDLGAIIRRVIDDLSDQARRQSIRLETELSVAPRLNVDATMIGEAVHVLIRNAIEAIGCQGTIVVSMILEPNGLIATADPPPRPRRVIIHVADSGPGVSKQTRRHAFDPYYSGREAGRGLGLGLCRAYRVVRLHHGRIELAGGPAGCVATITLPLG